MRTTRTAVNGLAASPDLPVARIRSPTAMSDTAAGVAVFRSVLPTGSCTILTASERVTVTGWPESGATVIALPAMAFTVPS